MYECRLRRERKPACDGQETKKVQWVGFNAQIRFCQGFGLLRTAIAALDSY
jgi:hypothetical protein